MLKNGDRVKINSKYGGIYDGLTGTVKENNPNVWYVRVLFDTPLHPSGYSYEIREEVFYPSECILVE